MWWAEFPSYHRQHQKLSIATTMDMERHTHWAPHMADSLQGQGQGGLCGGGGFLSAGPSMPVGPWVTRLVLRLTLLEWRWDSSRKGLSGKSLVSVGNLL